MESVNYNRHQFSITSRKITQFFGETEKICSIVSSLNIQFQALKSHHVKISLDFEFLNCQELNQNYFQIH